MPCDPCGVDCRRGRRIQLRYDEDAAAGHLRAEPGSDGVSRRDEAGRAVRFARGGRAVRAAEVGERGQQLASYRPDVLGTGALVRRRPGRRTLREFVEHRRPGGRRGRAGADRPGDLLCQLRVVQQSEVRVEDRGLVRPDPLGRVVADPAQLGGRGGHGRRRAAELGRGVAGVVPAQVHVASPARSPARSRRRDLIQRLGGLLRHQVTISCPVRRPTLPVRRRRSLCGPGPRPPRARRPRPGRRHRPGAGGPAGRRGWRPG